MITHSSHLRKVILEEGEEKFWAEEFPRISKTNLLYRRGHYYPFRLFTSTDSPNLEFGKNLKIKSWKEKQKYHLPAGFKAIKAQLINKEKIRRKKFGEKWWSDLQCKLKAIEVSGSYDEELVELHLETAEYADHFVSNIHLNKSVLPGGKTIREKFIKGPDDIFSLEDSALANQLATNTFVVNTDQMKGIIGIRSNNVAFRRGYYCITGGYIAVKSKKRFCDLTNGRPDLFKAAMREAYNETGLPIKNIACLGIGVDLIYGYPDMLFLAETSVPVEYVLSSPKKEYEFDPCIVDLKDPDEVYSYLDPRYIGTHDAACIILSVEKLLPDFYIPGRAGKIFPFKWADDKDKNKKKLSVRVWTHKFRGQKISQFEADQIVEQVKADEGLVIIKTGKLFKIFFGKKEKKIPTRKYVYPIIEHTLKNQGIAGDAHKILSVIHDQNIHGSLVELSQAREKVKRLQHATSSDECCEYEQAGATVSELEEKFVSFGNNLRTEMSRSVNFYLKPLKTKIWAYEKGSRSTGERAVYKLNPPISYILIER